MKFLVLSNFSPDINSGAAGSIIAINHGLESLGHEVVVDWGPTEKVSRVFAEVYFNANRFLVSASTLLSRHTDADVVVISQPYAYKAFAELRRRFPKTIFINRTHGWEARGIAIQKRFGWEPPTGIGRVLRPVSRAWTKRMCRLAVLYSDAVVTASKSDSDWIKQAYGVDDSKVFNIPYGLDLQNLPSLPDLSLPRKNTFIFAGNYLERKGAGVLNKLLPEIGEAYQDATLEMYIDERSISLATSRLQPAWQDRLRVSKWVGRSELYSAFARSKYMLLPSYFEGFGKTTIEALAMGCLVLGFREGHLSNLTDDVSRTTDIGNLDGFRRILQKAAQDELGFASDAAAIAAKTGRSRSWTDMAREFAEACLELRRRKGLIGGRDQGAP